MELYEIARSADNDYRDLPSIRICTTRRRLGMVGSSCLVIAAGSERGQRDYGIMDSKGSTRIYKDGLRMSNDSKQMASRCFTHTHL